MSQEDWDSDMLMAVQGRLIYIGQGQAHYVFFSPAHPSATLAQEEAQEKEEGRPSASSSTSSRPRLGGRNRRYPS
jgi:hypothetical protein